MQEEFLKNKKIAFIVAFRDFRDEECFIPKEALEKVGAQVSTVSDGSGVAIGAGGGETNVDILIGDLIVQDFDAIVFIGGSGALGHLDNEMSYGIAREAVEKDKVLGAICISPVILAKAGVLEGKRVTVWSSALQKSPIKALEKGGAIFESKNVVVDGKIITANGPDAAQEFGNALVEALTK